MPKDKTRYINVVNALTGSHIAYGLLIAAMAYGLSAAYSAGQARRAMVRAQVQETIAEEDRVFCERFGMRASSGEYRSCCQELAIIRQKQADRDQADAFSLL